MRRAHRCLIEIGKSSHYLAINQDKMMYDILIKNWLVIFKRYHRARGLNNYLIGTVNSIAIKGISLLQAFESTMIVKERKLVDVL